MGLEELRESQIATGNPYATDDGVRMRGQAYHGGYFDVPLIQKVKDIATGGGTDGDRTGGELWQGGCIMSIKLPEDFNFVLSLYPWEKYHLGPDTERLEVTMYDSLDQATEQADELADLVVGKLLDGQKVLVHCQAGLNRSGLITALALIKLGSTPSEAIDLLREQRTTEVLCNSAFEEFVRGQGA
jgi:protein-tyrosine phosphatase